MDNEDFEIKTQNYIKKEQFLEHNNCTHSLRVDLLCAICGAEIPKESSLVPALHLTDRIFQTAMEAKKTQKIKNKKLNSEKKLILILDLDQTVVHSTIQKIDCDFSFEIASMTFYVKMRPHLYRFLDKISKLFEIHIYTMGTRDYADEICKCLDPDKRYFGDRIVTRSENLNEMTKSIERITCIPENVVILDDRADVWGYVGNLVLIRPFWYKDKIDINDPSKIPIYAQDSTVVQDCLTLKIDENILQEPKPSENTAGCSGISQPVISIIKRTPLEGVSDPMSDRELLKILKILKGVHKRYFKTRRSTYKLLRLKFLRNIRIGSQWDNLQLISFAGATFDTENPNFVLENPLMARILKVKNVGLKWIYECIYKRKMIPIESYVTDNYNSVDDYQTQLESEFF